MDDDCALTTIVDGEIVVSKQNPKIDGIINALISFDKYFQHDPDFKMFNAFGGKTDLLFKVCAASFTFRFVLYCNLFTIKKKQEEKTFQLVLSLFRIQLLDWLHVMSKTLEQAWKTTKSFSKTWTIVLIWAQQPPYRSLLL